MGWRLLQITIIGAVLFANIHWQLTPNNYLAAIIGIGIAFATTEWLTSLFARIRGVAPQPRQYDHHA